MPPLPAHNNPAHELTVDLSSVELLSFNAGRMRPSCELLFYLDFWVVCGDLHGGGGPAGANARRCPQRDAHEGIRTECEAGESDNPCEHHIGSEREEKRKREKVGRAFCVHINIYARGGNLGGRERTPKQLRYSHLNI